MNDNDRQRLIHNYLHAADRLQRESEYQKSIEQDKRIFEQVIAELGLSTEQQQQLKQSALDDLNAAQDHFFKNEIAQSTELAERAHQLLPYDLRPLELLLRIAVQKKNHIQARFYAASILKLDPQHPEAKQALRHRKSLASPLLLSGIAILLIGLISLVFLEVQPDTTQPTDTLENNTVEQIPTVDNSEEKAKPEPVSDPPRLPNSKSQTISATPPIQINNIPLSGLQFVDRGSKLSEYSDSFSYEAVVLLTNNSTEEIKALSGVIELIAPDGSVIAQKQEDFRADYRPALRPGESEGLSTLLYVKSYPDNYQSPVLARLRLDELTHYPTAEEISKETIDLQWPTGHPRQFTLTVRRRSSTDEYGSYNELMDTWVVRNTYEITNSGDSLIRTLKIRQELLTENGTVFHKDSHLITYSSAPYIAPGETRLGFFIATSLPQKAAQIRLSVVEIN